jgi:hypothetical protein
MSGAGASPSPVPASPADVWHALLRPDVELSPAYCADLSRAGGAPHFR